MIALAFPVFVLSSAGGLIKSGIHTQYGFVLFSLCFALPFGIHAGFLAGRRYPMIDVRPDEGFLVVRHPLMPWISERLEFSQIEDIFDMTDRRNEIEMIVFKVDPNCTTSMKNRFLWKYVAPDQFEFDWGNGAGSAQFVAKQLQHVIGLAARV